MKNSAPQDGPQVVYSGLGEAMGKDTIYAASPTGRRLEGIIHEDDKTLSFAGVKVPLVGKMLVGRDRSCDIHIDNILVSKRHALIHKIKDEWFVTDLESTNGTFVNDERVPAGKYLKLSRGDHIRVGKTLLSFA